MDDPLARIEGGLERLVPRGLSDTGKSALEAQIDELADGADRDHRGGHRGGWWAAAAAVAMLAAVGLWPHNSGSERGSVAESPPERSIEADMVTAALQINDRFDGGWVYGDGFHRPYRYHGYDVTDETEIVDGETGYQVRVLERREEWIPVQVTSL